MNKRFFKKYFIYLGCLVAVICVGLAVLWASLKNYEAESERGVSAAVAGCLESGRAAEIYAQEASGPWSNAEADAEYLNSAFSGKEVNFRRVKTEEAGRIQTYRFSSDGEDIADVVLIRKGEPNGLGLSRYEVGEIRGINTVIVRTAHGIVPALNNTELSQDYMTGSGIVYEIFSDIPSSAVEAPTYNEYTFTLLDPQCVISAQGCSAYNEEDGVFLLYNPSDETRGQLDALTREIAPLYSQYVTYDVDWGRLSGYFLRGTYIYSKLSNLEVMWFSEHDGSYYENMEIFNVKQYSDTCVSLEVKYDYCVTSGANVTRYDTHLTFCYVYVNGSWMVGNLIVN